MSIPKMRVSDRWYKRIVRDSRYNDRKAGRVIDPTCKFISTARLFALQAKQSNRCYYCQTNMALTNRRSNPSGLTLERLDTIYPHYSSNCVLCCKRCNSKRYCRDIGLLKRYFSIWKRKALHGKSPDSV